MMRDSVCLNRRDLLAAGGILGLTAGLARATPAYAWSDTGSAALLPEITSSGERVVDLAIGAYRFGVDGKVGEAIAINGSVPGPLLRFRQGEEAVIRVTNRLAEGTSIHWHGILVPPDMDGVPGVSFGGIAPKTAFTYRFPLYQSGTYWCHSHSGAQELVGVYAPLIIDPIDPEPFAFDRDYVVMLSDWSFETPGAIIAHLKKEAGYYNYQKRTLGDLLRDVGRDGWSATLLERLRWSKMRMDPTDFADVTGYTYTYLCNGLTTDANWTGLFKPGEQVRLRFIAAGAMTYFDIRIPGLKMTVVQADGQNVRPIVVDEFRIAPGETFDVVVVPGNQAYTVFAEAMDRSGFARGTLAPRTGMTAPIPPRRQRPLRTMADMGMDMAGMDSPKSSRAIAMTPGTTAAPSPPVMNMTGGQIRGMSAAALARDAAAAQVKQMGAMAGMPSSAHDNAGMAADAVTIPKGPGFIHGADTHGVGNSSIAMVSRNRLDEPGSGFDDPASRVLVYTDLRSVAPQSDVRPPTREIELHITGNMDRYIWSFNGLKYSQARTPIPFAFGERLRLVFVNDTMMEHPIHLHGMWMELENGGGAHQPRKHTVSVKPAERLTVAVTADAPGQWVLHCHLLLHMDLGMLRVVEVAAAPVVGA
jgi:CopA family copper-resistance protein